jgi:anthranilate phosphoribosyltransferase
MIRESIAALAEGKHLDRAQARATMLEIMSGEATPAQVAAYITALRIRGESAEIIAGSAEAMRQKFTAVEAGAPVVADIVGTGGDGAHTFNISTCAAFVAAGAGVVVAKHGNRSVSSKCGSADVLAALGVNLEIGPDVMARALRDIGVAFLFAPALHPAMKHAIGPRREIGIRTIFNILGPISNPAGAQYGLVGVYAAALVPVLAEALAALGAQHMFVVHGLDGLDEITTTTGTLVAEIQHGHVRQYEIHPRDVGLASAQPADLLGGEPPANAEIIRSLLAGQRGPKRDIVLLNSAAAIYAAGKARDLKDAVVVAAHSIDSGAARQKLEALAKLTSSIAKSA